MSLSHQLPCQVVAVILPGLSLPQNPAQTPSWLSAAHSWLTSLIFAEFAFCQVDASSALDLALAVLCDLLQQWDQLTPGLPVLLGWLLGEGEDLVACEESAHQVIPRVSGGGGVSERPTYAHWRQHLTGYHEG